MIPLEELSEAVAKRLGWIIRPDGKHVVCNFLKIENAIGLMERDEWPHTSSLRYMVTEIGPQYIVQDFMESGILYEMTRADTPAEAICRAFLKLRADKPPAA